jgi:hypothetical protein
MATDLVMAVDAADKRVHKGNIDHLLPAGAGRDDESPSRIQVIYDVIRDEEWMPNLVRWHSRAALEPAPIKIDARPAVRAMPPEPEPQPVPA